MGSFTEKKRDNRLWIPCLLEELLKPAMKADDKDSEEEEEDQCAHCHESPCILETEEGKNLLTTGLQMRDNKNNPNKNTWFCLCKNFTQLIHGHLGKGKRVPPPEQIVTEIQEEFPPTEAAKKFTDFHEGAD